MKEQPTLFFWNCISCYFINKYMLRKFKNAEIRAKTCNKYLSDNDFIQSFTKFILLKNSLILHIRPLKDFVTVNINVYK